MALALLRKNAEDRGPGGQGRFVLHWAAHPGLSLDQVRVPPRFKWTALQVTDNAVFSIFSTATRMLRNKHIFNVLHSTHTSAPSHTLICLPFGQVGAVSPSSPLPPSSDLRVSRSHSESLRLLWSPWHRTVVLETPQRRASELFLPPRGLAHRQTKPGSCAIQEPHGGTSLPCLASTLTHPLPSALSHSHLPSGPLRSQASS